MGGYTVIPPSNAWVGGEGTYRLPTPGRYTHHPKAGESRGNASGDVTTFWRASVAVYQYRVRKPILLRIQRSSKKCNISSGVAGLVLTT